MITFLTANILINFTNFTPLPRASRNIIHLILLLFMTYKFEIEISNTFA